MRTLLLIGAFTLGLLRPSDAAACSCLGASVVIVGPDRVTDAPLNSRIRLEVPAKNPMTGAPSSASSALVRVTDTGAKADVTERHWQDGSQLFIELTPSKPLAPDTRYEVAVVSSDPNAYPSTTVLSTFKTGTASDTTPPKLDRVGTPVAKGNARAGGGDCTIQGPWIEIPNIVASDPGRPNAKLMFAIWSADAAGNLDTSKPPAVLVNRHLDQVTVGRQSLCDTHDFPIPSTVNAMTLAIAAVDEAGNMSTPKRLPKVSVAGVGSHP